MDTERSDENSAQQNETTPQQPQAPAAQQPAPQPLAQAAAPSQPVQQPAPPQAHEHRAPQEANIPPRPPMPPYTGQQAPQQQAPQFTAPGPHPFVQPAFGQQVHAPQAGYPGQAFGQPAPQGHPGQAQGHPGQAHTQPTQPLPHEFRMAAPGAPGPQKAPRKGGAGKVAALLVAAAIVGGTAGIGGSALWNQFSGPAGSPSAASGPSNITVNNPGSVNEATAVATQVLPSVVTIDVSDGNQGGSGSGVILSEDGYVVTNTHVVTLGGATADGQIRVTTSDGRIYGAEVVGTDPTYDLAVIKLKDASGLTPIEFADSSKLNVGDTTAAVGAPLGLPNTVTTGIVSALNRSIEIASSAAPDSGDQTQPGPGEEDQSPFRFDNGQPQQSTPSQSISIAVIQTDAAINHGNSGGALVDSKGRLIGINVAIASSGGDEESGSIGVGFAIPSNIVQRVSDQLKQDGEATHGLLGASVQPSIADADATVSGALIADVTPGGAAEKAGLDKGDIVTAFNGVPISNATDLTAQVRAVAGGGDATVTYVRDGQSRDVDVTLGTLQQ